ncbi:hypothetical protein EO98_19465 [Methanosarcina sp. 2.H.T.1A.6]|jgi:hypothetical protein|uniref:hypothetical protein n=1 Tax=unclassified Methanosarcina TaxID=2644672 RepID=UPI000621F154|nr:MULTISPECIES: hypothetical protein [unclassified Methanosarcina]KKG10912.1 hypothetical protein EO97_03405 [Methanosarcina sp. 2.H.T.1A.15]KKG13043.1 hypothetical protein EO92_07665 [Methanosarcina sp. 2.H.A.1B.4]KKG17834.1 hypothetical protein EO94_14895 [Methanosarcina sp. 2.H.T.1A.3]KKG19431.1 hypothetical protein EO98_19465 [Methanosarcina sp. 2.H.T.1A.6]KKG27481.1 hypothetical protein EO96_10840 [Methanosarcina sp. 2.H.T.1A.8]
MTGEKIDRKIFEELNFIKKQLAEIKEHMVDIDALLTAEEKELVFRSFENEARGRLVPLKKLEKTRI